MHSIFLWCSTRSRLAFADWSWRGEAQKVADAMSAAWIAFARTGDPNAPGVPEWPPFDSARRATMVFNVKSSGHDDPVGEERRILGESGA